MSQYGQRWDDILTMPIRVFWALFRQISIINAEDSLRLLRVIQLSQSTDKNALREFGEDNQNLIETAIIPNREIEAKEGRALLKSLASK